MPLQTHRALMPLTAESDTAWYEAMMRAIARCAPVVVRAFAKLNGEMSGSLDRNTLAGRVILLAAETACSEGWGCDEFETRAEATVMECIATEFEGISACGVHESLGPATPRRRLAVLQALEHLDDLRLQVLALIVQEGLTVPEVASVLGLPEWRVHQECAQAVGQIKRQVCAVDSESTSGPRWFVEPTMAGGGGV